MGSSILVCPMCCGETFNNSQSLKYHLLSMTDNLYCPSCSQRTDSVTALIQHLDKCGQEQQNGSEDFKVTDDEVLMDTNVEEINENFLATVDNRGIMIVNGPRTIEVDEHGEIKVVERRNISENLSENDMSSADLTQHDCNNLRMKHLKCENDNLEQAPVISIPDSLMNEEKSVLELIPDDSTNFLETEENLIELNHHDEEIGEEELMKVKQELCEVTGDEIDSTTVYNCSSCKMSFNSVLDHINMYHDDQEVVLEMANDTVEEQLPQLSPKAEIPGPVTRSRQRRPMNTLRTEECIDAEGRLYTRKVVQIERFWDPNTGNNSSQNTIKQAPMIEKFFSNAEGIKTRTRNESTPQRMYRCNQCLEQFPRLGEFRTHVCVNGSNQCDNCEQAFATAKALQLHIKTHDIEGTIDGQKSFTCKVCGTEFATHKSLRLHSRMHAPVRARHVDAPEGTNNSRFTCQECGKSLSVFYRKAHMSLHAGDSVTCAVCNRKFDSADSLAMHAAVHPELGVQNNQNLQGNQTQQQQQQQQLIQLSINPPSPSPTPPGIINTSGNTTITNEVADTIDTAKPYQCQHCGRRFTRPHEKVKHERIHTGEKPHACEVCGKTFRVSYCLTLHMRTHTGVRPYQCQHCGKRFKASSVYNHHLLTHGDERAYTCPYCPKTFKTRVQLAGHKNSHTKPFRCTECSRPFASLYAARAHIQTHKKDNNLKFSCIICGASYGRAFALKDHLKVHDPDILLPPEPAREEEVHEDFLLEEEEILEEELVNSGIQINVGDPE
ncbi:hypothetical protein PV328_004732 [Microctonus aethiopoides]|uniref:C2H2-type domain-containing protein n=1 Tax=Microctonus aethiopoides TaxID=144406 RepID=A0AA39KLY0_9HYME|nr:hypothetical protein PV328_004732 [Microctonus aethiopoides]